MENQIQETTSRNQLNSLNDLFINELRDIYWSEQAIVKFLPRLNQDASSTELKDILDDHLDVTEVHIKRLEEIFVMLDVPPTAKRCETMVGMMKETDELVRLTTGDTMVRESALIACVQKMEHYEIAAYGTLRSMAATLGYEEVVDLLQATLEEEKEADLKLSDLAESYVNEEANNE